MDVRQHFKLPTRVSRLYPLFALGLLLSSSALVYTWKYTQINTDVVVAQQNQEIDQLKAQVQSLLSQQKSDQSTLKVQKEKIDAAATQLAALQAEVKSKTDELQQAQGQVKNQQDQLAQNATELQQLRTHPPLFSFENDSRQADVTEQEAQVKEVVSKAYQYIQDMYDTPYLLNSIKISFVDQFSITGSSGEIIIENGPNGISINIHIKSFDKNNFQDDNTIIHEMIHGFHGAAVLQSSAFEEGMTVAATDAVMAKMIADGALPTFSPLYLTINDQQYAFWNQTLAVAEDSTTFYSDPNVSKVYQLVGTAWMRLYREDPLFFKKLNDAYYPKVQKGIKPDDALIKDLIRSIVPSIQGVSIETYLSQNRAFNPS